MSKTILDIENLLGLNSLTDEQFDDYSRKSIRKLVHASWRADTGQRTNPPIEEEMIVLKNHLSLVLFKEQAGIHWNKVRVYMRGVKQDVLWEDLSGWDVEGLKTKMENLKALSLSSLYEQWAQTLGKDSK